MKPLSKGEMLADWQNIAKQLDRWQVSETKPDGTPLNLYGRLLACTEIQRKAQVEATEALILAASSATDWLEDADPGSDPKERGDALRAAIKKVKGEA